jgi:hypothetical protein
MTNSEHQKRATTTRRVPGRWLFIFPALLLASAGWFTWHPWQSSASSPVGKEFSEDLFSPDRYRVLPDGMIEDTATGLVRKLESGHVGSTPSAADIRAFISLTNDQRADLREGVGPRPVHLLVGAIGVDADVVPIGLDVNRALAVPRDAQVTGWWSGGSIPGENGPTVIVGHFDSKVASGVFAKLQTLQKGARITVEDSAGSKYVYEVVEMEHLHKTAFPTEKVYGPTDASTLRLVTCGGKFNRVTGHYVDNTIAYAVLVSAHVVGPPDRPPVAEDVPDKIAPVFPLFPIPFEASSDALVSDASFDDAPGGSSMGFPTSESDVTSTTSTPPGVLNSTESSMSPSAPIPGLAVSTVAGNKPATSIPPVASPTATPSLLPAAVLPPVPSAITTNTSTPVPPPSSVPAAPSIPAVPAPTAPVATNPPVPAGVTVPPLGQDDSLTNPGSSAEPVPVATPV